MHKYEDEKENCKLYKEGSEKSKTKNTALNK